jgi:hypothetical protein
MGDVIGIAEHYGQFVALCRLRVEQLNVTFETIDQICGFPARYAGKLLSPNGERPKTMSAFSLFTLARGLALMPTFVHDAKQLRLLQGHSAWRKRAWSGKHAFSPEFLKFRSRRGNYFRTKKVPFNRRVAIARAAAQARWAKVHNPV